MESRQLDHSSARCSEEYRMYAKESSWSCNSHAKHSHPTGLEYRQQLGSIFLCFCLSSLSLFFSPMTSPPQFWLA